MTAADFSDKWSKLPPAERRLTGIRAIELADPAAEATAIALALREAVETPGQTAALVTPDRMLASRVSALLARWGIDADDSAGRPLSQWPAGTLLLAIAAAAAETFAPVALLALLKHPLVGGDGDARLGWLDKVRELDLGLRGPRPAPGLAGLDRHFKEQGRTNAWGALRDLVKGIEARFAGPLMLAALAAALRQSVAELCGDGGWSGPDGRMAGELIAELEAADDARTLALDPEEWVPALRHMLDARPVRPPGGLWAKASPHELRPSFRPPGLILSAADLFLGLSCSAHGLFLRFARRAFGLFLYPGRGALGGRLRPLCDAVTKVGPIVALKETFGPEVEIHIEVKAVAVQPTSPVADPHVAARVKRNGHFAIAEFQLIVMLLELVLDARQIDGDI
jgi:hypothetical protein